MHEGSRRPRSMMILSPALFDLEGPVSRARRHCSPAREQQHYPAEHQHYNSPPEVDIDTERMTRVHFAASRRRSISTHQHAKYAEHHADWQSDIESHTSPSDLSRPGFAANHRDQFHFSQLPENPIEHKQDG